MKIIVVGGVAGGASAAARLRRLDEQAEIILFEKGEYISYANCGLPYYIGNVIKERNKLLVQTAASFSERFNIEVRTLSEVLSIDTENKQVSVRNQSTGEVYNESYDKMVLSPGADPIRPPLPGINLDGIFTLRNVNDTDYIKAHITEKKIKSAVVVGAGFIGIEMAENLHHVGVEVSVIEMGDQILAPLDFPMASIVQQHVREKGVSLKLKTAVQGFEKDGDKLIVNLNTGEKLTTDLVILSIGVRPDTHLAKDAGLALGKANGIFVNEYLQTSNADIYAVGDAIEFENSIINQSMITYLAGPANKQGRMAADNLVMGNVKKYNGAINTAIVKVFDLTVAAAGMAFKHLERFNIEHIVSTTHSGSHAGYYPDSQQMTIQLAFSPKDGRLLSGQVVGREGVDKRIDILSSVIARKSDIYELTEFEHAYAPPFSSAKDPVNMAGFVAENILQKKMQVVYWKDVAENKDNAFILDARNPDEHAIENIVGAVNIPVDQLRNRLDELPKDRKIFVYCEVGLRGYLASRILLQSGFPETYNISGGMKLYHNCHAERELLNEPVLQEA